MKRATHLLLCTILAAGLSVGAYRESFAESAVRFVRRYRTPILLVLAYLVMRAVLLIFLGR